MLEIHLGGGPNIYLTDWICGLTGMSMKNAPEAIKFLPHILIVAVITSILHIILAQDLVGIGWARERSFAKEPETLLTSSENITSSSDGVVRADQDGNHMDNGISFILIWWKVTLGAPMVVLVMVGTLIWSCASQNIINNQGYTIQSKGWSNMLMIFFFVLSIFLYLCNNSVFGSQQNPFILFQIG